MAVFPEFSPEAEIHELTTDDGVKMRVVIDGHGPDIVFIPGGDQTALFAYSDLIR